MYTYSLPQRSLCFLMCCVLLAERAILSDFHAFRMSLLVLGQIVVPMLALGAC